MAKRMDGVLKVVIQLFKEFVIQIVISTLWGFWKISDLNGADAVQGFLTNFCGCLFLTSWFLGQILRVKKQLSVEASLNSITGDL